jgi:endonuclease YncB( thermonuclease family)
MIKLAAAFLLLPTLVLATPVGVTYPAVITRIIDGDTVVIKATYLPKPLRPELAVRIFGVDTPEKGSRSGCVEEDAKGHAATAFTTAAINNAKNKQVSLIMWDKYGGRILGDIILDNKSLRAMLIDNGFAREYFGDVKKSWCDK